MSGDLESLLSSLESLDLDPAAKAKLSGKLRRLKISKKFRKVYSDHFVIFDEVDKKPVILSLRECKENKYSFICSKCMAGNGFQDIETDKLIFEEVTSQSCDHAKVCYLLFPGQTQSTQKLNPYVTAL